MSYISQITQPDGTKLRVSLRDTEANSVAVKVDGSAVTQPVSGTITATVADGLGVKLYDTVSASYVGVPFADGKPRVINQDYLQAVAEGSITGHTPWSKIGYNDNIGTSQETMWSYSSEYVWITTPGQVEVLSSDANDTAAGTGARTVRVDYLKSDYTEGTVDLTLNGITTVPSGASHADIFRINSFRVMTTGTNNAPVGNLTLRQATGGLYVSYIRAGKTRARSCFYTVPHGKTLFITSIAFSAVGTKYLIFTTHANWDSASGTLLPTNLFWPYSEVALLNSSYTKFLEMPTKLGQHADLKVSVVAEAAGSLGTCHLRGWLE